METPPPKVLALVVADRVYRDDDSGKLFALGIRSVIGASSFPLEHVHLAAYVALVNGRGETTVGVQLIDADEERGPLAEGEALVTFPDPIAEVELVFDFHGLTFPEPGEYRLQLRSNRQFLRERVLVVRPAES